MTDGGYKTNSSKIIRRNTIKLPAVFIEECGSPLVDVHYGKNYSCVVIVPKESKLGAKTIERISKLVSEPLTTER